VDETICVEKMISTILTDFRTATYQFVVTFSPTHSMLSVSFRKVLITPRLATCNFVLILNLCHGQKVLK
jgi:hypothetical protein